MQSLHHGMEITATRSGRLWRARPLAFLGLSWSPSYGRGHKSVRQTCNQLARVFLAQHGLPQTAPIHHKKSCRHGTIANLGDQNFLILGKPYQIAFFSGLFNRLFRRWMLVPCTPTLLRHGLTQSLQLYPWPACLSTEDGTILFLNPALARALGTQTQTLVGTKFCDLFIEPPAYDPKTPRRVQGTLQGCVDKWAIWDFWNPFPCPLPCWTCKAG
jgi:PAS domain-containing protein